MMLKTETVAPMPSASDRIAVRAKPGCLRIWRSAKRRSCRMVGNGTSALALNTEAAINDVDLTRREAGFIGGQIDSQGRNFLGTAQSPHRLPGNKLGIDLLYISLRCDALVQRR